MDDINQKIDQNMFKNEDGFYTCAICGKVGVEKDSKNRKVNMRDHVETVTWRDSHSPVRALTNHSGQDAHLAVINLNITVLGGGILLIFTNLDIIGNRLNIGL